MIDQGKVIDALNNEHTGAAICAMLAAYDDARDGNAVRAIADRLGVPTATLHAWVSIRSAAWRGVTLALGV
jgi:hypothetical protein